MRTVLVALLLLGSACGGGGHDRDGGARADAGPGARDAGRPSDGGPGAADAGAPRDAGEIPVDGGRPTGPAACDRGGEMAGSGGAEAPFGEAVVGLCRQALGCPSTWALAPPPDGYRTRGTPNHKLLWRIWYYGWAQRAGTPAQVDDARTFLVSFFDAQRTFGHQAISDGANEVLTTSHYQIWANGMTCARLLAVHHADPALLDATGTWWRAEEALYDALERGGAIDAPGARFRAGGGGPNQLREVLHAMIEGRALPGRAGDPSTAWWDDYYNVSAWTMRETLRLGDDLGGAATAGPADLPRLSDALYLRESGADWVLHFPRLRGALEPLFWVAFIDGAKQYAPHAAGTPVDSPVPPPDLPGATDRVLVPGVM